MERGLLWLPLLGLFIWLAWAGWNEYQKVEAYKEWAAQFKRAKYDIYAVLGQRGDELVWGKPTRTTPIELQSVKLSEIKTVRLTIAGTPVPIFPLQPSTSGDPKPGDPADPTDATFDRPATDFGKTAAQKGKVELRFELNSGEFCTVPFTDRNIAEQWYRFLASRVAVR